MKPFGPVQLQLVPLLQDRFIALPSQTGPLVAAAATRFPTLTFVVAVEVQEPIVTVTVYAPELTAPDPGMEGFCDEEVNPFGPLHE